MNQVLVGIDSGGTRTNVEVLVESENGVEHKTYETTDSLSGTLAPDLIPEVLRKIFAPLEMHIEELNAVGLPVFAWFSAAGFSPWTRDDYAIGLDELVPDYLVGSLKTLGAANDAVSLLLGSGSDGVVIAGTGSNIMLQSKDGEIHQSGGHDWVACDYGSGFWIALRSIRQAYRDHEAGQESVLLHRFEEVYGIDPDDRRSLIAKLRDLSVSDRSMKKEIAKFAANVCAAAERGDAGAQNIVKAEAEDLADIMAGSLRRNFSSEELTQGIVLVQGGSVLDNDFYRVAFETQLDMRLRLGEDRNAQIEWQRVTTVGEAAINLARAISTDPTPLLKVDRSFRPAVVHA